MYFLTRPFASASFSIRNQVNSAGIELLLRSSVGFLSRPLHSRISFVFVDQCTDLNQDDLTAFREFERFDGREHSRRFCLQLVSTPRLVEVHSSL